MSRHWDGFLQKKKALNCIWPLTADDSKNFAENLSSIRNSLKFHQLLNSVGCEGAFSDLFKCSRNICKYMNNVLGKIERRVSAT